MLRRLVMLSLICLMIKYVRLYSFIYFNYLKHNSIEINMKQKALLLYARLVLGISLDSHMILGF